MNTKTKNKRTEIAKEFGTAVAKGFLKDYQEHPEWFPKGFESLRRMSESFAKVSLYQSLFDPFPSPDEEYISAKAALDFWDNLEEESLTTTKESV